jgi:hypothetical protein
MTALVRHFVAVFKCEFGNAGFVEVAQPFGDHASYHSELNRRNSAHFEKLRAADYG